MLWYQRGGRSSRDAQEEKLTTRSNLAPPDLRPVSGTDQRLNSTATVVSISTGSPFTR